MVFGLFKKKKDPLLKVAKRSGINSRDDSDTGKTVLHKACCENASVELITKLLKKYKADVNCRDNNGEAALHFAASWGRSDVVKILLQVPGIDVNVRDTKGMTPLNAGSREGDNAYDAIEMLVKRKADLAIGDEDGWTPLHSCCSNGALRIPKLLIAAGACVDTTDNGGFTPLHMASRRGHLATAKILFELGASAEARSATEFMTPLHYACVEGHQHLVEWLSSQVSGAVDAEDKDGWTPLMLASRWGFPDIVQYLLGRGADANHLSRDVSAVGALHTSSRWGHEDVVRKLLEGGAQSSLRSTYNGMTPLHFAAMMDRTDVLKVLAAGGADLEAKDDRGGTPLLRAVTSGHQAATRCLLDLGCDLSPCISVDGHGKMNARELATWAGMDNLASMMEDYEKATCA